MISLIQTRDREEGDGGEGVEYLHTGHRHRQETQIKNRRIVNKKNRTGRQLTDTQQGARAFVISLLQHQHPSVKLCCAVVAQN